jgi:hypothetical protein
MIKNTPLRVDCLLMLRTQKTRILHLNQYHAHKRHRFYILIDVTHTKDTDFTDGTRILKNGQFTIYNLQFTVYNLQFTTYHLLSLIILVNNWYSCV